jgi:hypothetical protein
MKKRRLAFLIVTSAVCAVGYVLRAVIVLLNSRVESSSLPTPAVPDLAIANLSEIHSQVDAYERRLMTTREALWQLFHGLLARSEDYKALMLPISESTSVVFLPHTIFHIHLGKE